MLDGYFGGGFFDNGLFDDGYFGLTDAIIPPTPPHPTILKPGGTFAIINISALDIFINNNGVQTRLKPRSRIIQFVDLAHSNIPSLLSDGLITLNEIVNGTAVSVTISGKGLPPVVSSRPVILPQPRIPVTKNIGKGPKPLFIVVNISQSQIMLIADGTNITLSPKDKAIVSSNISNTNITGLLSNKSVLVNDIVGSTQVIISNNNGKIIPQLPTPIIQPAQSSPVTQTIGRGSVPRFIVVNTSKSRITLIADGMNIILAPKDRATVLSAIDNTNINGLVANKLISVTNLNSQ